MSLSDYVSDRNYTNVAPPQALQIALTADYGDIQVAVASTDGYPAAPFLLAVDRGTPDEEVMRCTSYDATTFTVERAFDGTSLSAHDAGAVVEHTVAAIDYQELNDLANALPGLVALLTNGKLDGYNLIDYAETVNALGDVSGLVVPSYNDGNVVTMTLVGDTVFDQPNDLWGAGAAISMVYIITQDATGNHQVTWNFVDRWAEATPHEMTPDANVLDIVTLIAVPSGAGPLWLGMYQQGFA